MRVETASAATGTWAWFNARGFGKGVVVCRHGAITQVLLPPVRTDEFPSRTDLPAKPATEGDAVEVAKALEECFTTGAAVQSLTFRLEGRTPFQERVLRACHRIPRGEAWSYAKLAKAAGAPKAVRAVGTVMATNPLPLIIPCHRVVKSDGSIGNFGGADGMKERLLQLEKN